MRSLQLELRRQWDFVDESVVLPWTPEIELDVLWWYDTDHLLQGVSLEVQHPDLRLWSNALDQGWGAHLRDQFVSCRSVEERSLSINLRELCAICLGLMHFGQSLQGMTVGVFMDNTAALSYVKRQGGTHSVAFNQEVQHLLWWAESVDLSLVPKFIMGSQNVVADSLSRRQQVLGSEWTLALEVVDELVARWPATVDLFATALNYWLPVFFSPLSDPMSAGTDAFLQDWDGLQAYAFPPLTLICQVLNKLMSSTGTYLTLIAPF